jgi:hypothetical protein
MSKYTPPDPTAGSASVASKGWTSKSPGLTASSKCGNSCWIGSEERETAWTVICTQPPVPVGERQVHRPDGGSDSVAHDFGRQHERGQPAGAARTIQPLCMPSDHGTDAGSLVDGRGHCARWDHRQYRCQSARSRHASTSPARRSSRAGTLAAGSHDGRAGWWPGKPR